MTDDARTRGLDRMQEVYGWRPPEIDSAHFATTVDHLFADIWTRPGLSDRDRRLLLIGALTAQGRMETIEIQLQGALHNTEFTEEQLREIALFLCHYVGWPNGTRLDAAISTVTQRLSADGEPRMRRLK
ncbi:carboxymuconolactone decarboxylase family protein [Nocardia thailandica]|uniref:Carboxymuconolactone decarboxylase family protein n=1 Tax=Nocardia thailandica TaxID=257275 RepID=A0ABW6PRL8_9NOCA|nr:carboxymuconolactone decarboxylase family protein [Nocardia thailandica]